MSTLVGFGEVAFLLDEWALLIAAAAAVAAVVGTAILLAGKAVLAGVLIGAAVALSCGVAIESVTVPPRIWEQMHAAIQTAPSAEKPQRKRELAALWNHSHEQIRVRHWLYLARAWGVCHELWRQHSCKVLIYEPVGVGVARELLTDAANEALYLPNASFEVTGKSE